MTKSIIKVAKTISDHVIHALEKYHSIIYGYFCGNHPYQNILHDEWLATKDIHADIKKYGGKISGRILDIGCGSKPYISWFKKVTKYTGLDIHDEKGVDIVVKENQKLPFPDSSFDAVVSFQVFEHIDNLSLTLKEVDRILRPGGVIMLTLPFMAYEHASPSDYRRFTVNGVKQLFNTYKVLKIIPEGKIGSSLGAIIIAFIKISSNMLTITHLLWMILLPVWIVLVLFINLISIVFDQVDKTKFFYSNVMYIAKKMRN